MQNETDFVGCDGKIRHARIVDKTTVEVEELSAVSAKSEQARNKDRSLEFDASKHYDIN